MASSGLSASTRGEGDHSSTPTIRELAPAALRAATQGRGLEFPSAGSYNRLVVTLCYLFRFGHFSSRCRQFEGKQLCLEDPLTT